MSNSNDEQKLSECTLKLKEVFRALAERMLGLNHSTASQMRHAIEQGQACPAEFARGLNALRYQCLKLAEQRPYLLIFGMLAWLYLSISFICALTFKI